MPPLASVRSRLRWNEITSRAADVVASKWWPPAMLVIGLLILLQAPSSSVRGLPVLLLIPAAAILGLVTWRALDLTSERSAHRAASVVVALIAILLAGGLAFAAVRVLGLRGASATQVALIGPAIVVAAAYARWTFGRAAFWRQAAVLAALASWICYLDTTLLTRPFRDARLYIEAGRVFAAGSPVYMTSPMTAVPADWASLPYLYPPFTLPFFGALSRLPHAIAVGSVVAACGLAVVAGLLLLGVPWRLVPLLLVWPPLAIGVQVGNVACIGFFLLAAAWRWGAAAPLTGVFKAQSGVVALWLVRERRWRALVIGAVIGLVLVLVTLPFTGVAMYVDWVHALGYFQASLANFPSTMGLALQRYSPELVAIALAALAVVIGLLVGGRQGLARLGIAAVVASPTVYIHGIAFGLPALLMLDATTFWILSALTPWGLGGWWTLAIGLAVLVLGLSRRQLAGTRQPASAPFDVEVHPLGSLPEPWPDALHLARFGERDG